jgi:hypothetical protein
VTAKPQFTVDYNSSGMMLSSIGCTRISIKCIKLFHFMNLILFNAHVLYETICTKPPLARFHLAAILVEKVHILRTKPKGGRHTSVNTFLWLTCKRQSNGYATKKKKTTTYDDGVCSNNTKIRTGRNRIPCIAPCFMGIMNKRTFSKYTVKSFSSSQYWQFGET